MKKFIIILLTFFAYSCSSLKQKESPVIYFSNASEQPIFDLKCVWAKNEVMTLPFLAPGYSRSQSFYINNNDEFFGAVSISWKNNNKQTIFREFDFKDNNLPSIKNERSYDFVQFYLDQDEFEIISSDAPDLSWKTQRMDRMLEKYRKSNVNKSRPANSGLIRIEHLKHQNYNLYR